MNLSDKTLQQTVLHGAHERVGGRMVPFAGFSMPIQYESILAEVRAVRHNHGMFDVSHMARFFIDGSDARSLLDWVHSADIGESMPVGQARYGLILLFLMENYKNPNCMLLCYTCFNFSICITISVSK